MPKQSTNRNDTWFINQPDKTWTLTKNAKITVDNGHGIYESSTGNTIKVLGDIKVSGMAYGIYLDGFGTDVLVGIDSRINAKQGVAGISSGAAGAHIENRGLVEGSMAAIYGSIWSDIENYGTLRGENGIEHDGMGSQIYNYGRIEASTYAITEMAGGNHIENGKKGVIIGDEKGIFLEGDGDAKIVNRGTLRGEVAIETEGDAQTVLNTGRIIGDVLLGDGDDRFDTRKGSVNGDVHGGEGDDTYLIGKSKITIVEDGSSGYDTVRSLVSHKLAANVEELTLLGKKDLNATGNAQTNWLYGNGGDNVLKGGGGTDYLYGNGGDDTLIGGTGAADYFIFDRRGVDRITDFEDGMDRLVIKDVNSQDAFDALNIKQLQGGDLQINFGNGNKIIIEDLLKSDFTYSEDVTFIL